MQEADVDLDGLDWIVCHSGADIWHGQQDGQWEADDHWEQLIDFRHALPLSCAHSALKIIASMSVDAAPELQACSPPLIYRQWLKTIASMASGLGQLVGSVNSVIVPF